MLLYPDIIHNSQSVLWILPEHMISLPMWSWWFHPFILLLNIYRYSFPNLSVLWLWLRINDWFVFLDQSDCYVYGLMTGLFSWIKRIPRCHFFGTELSRLIRSHSQARLKVPFPGEPSGEPGNGTWRAGTTLYRRNDSVGFFFSPVTIKLLQRIRPKTSFDQFCIHFIWIYRLLWSSARVRNKLLTNHRRDIKTQGEGRWTRQGWIYPMFDVIRHIFIIPLQNQRNSKGENSRTAMFTD